MLFLKVHYDDRGLGPFWTRTLRRSVLHSFSKDFESLKVEHLAEKNLFFQK